MPTLSSTARLSFGSSAPASTHRTSTFWAARDSATAVPPIPVPMTHTSASSRGSLSAATSTEPGLPPPQVLFCAGARPPTLGGSIHSFREAQQLSSLKNLQSEILPSLLKLGCLVSACRCDAFVADRRAASAADRGGRRDSLGQTRHRASSACCSALRSRSARR